MSGMEHSSSTRLTILLKEKSKEIEVEECSELKKGDPVPEERMDIISGRQGLPRQHTNCRVGARSPTTTTQRAYLRHGPRHFRRTPSENLSSILEG